MVPRMVMAIIIVVGTMILIMLLKLPIYVDVAVATTALVASSDGHEDDNGDDDVS